MLRRPAVTGAPVKASIFEIGLRTDLKVVRLANAKQGVHSRAS